MAKQNGIITGDQAAKLNSYPNLNSSASSFLNGTGAWTAINDATSAAGGLMSADDKAFLDALKTGSFKAPETNADTGALEYKYKGNVILSVPVASGE